MSDTTPTPEQSAQDEALRAMLEQAAVYRSPDYITEDEARAALAEHSRDQPGVDDNEMVLGEASRSTDSEVRRSLTEGPGGASRRVRDRGHSGFEL